MDPIVLILILLLVFGGGAALAYNLLIVLLVLALLGGTAPVWSYSHSWGYAPWGIILFIVIVFVLADRWRKRQPLI